MAFYYLFPIAVFLFVYLEKEKKWAGIVLLLIMTFFSMFRGMNVGIDTSRYLLEIDSNAVYFKSLTTDSIGVTKYEILYNLLCFIVWNYNLPPAMVLYVMSIVTFAFLYLAAKRYEVRVLYVLFFYIFLGFYYHSFNIARQLAAVSIGLYALSYLKENTLKKYLFFLYVIIASLIHNSLILFLPLYFLKYANFSRNVVAIFVFSFYFIATLIPITPIFFKLMENMDVFYNDNYGGRGAYAVVERTTVGILFNLVLGFIFMIIYFDRKTQKRMDLLDGLLLFFLVISSLLTYGNLGTFRVVMSFSVIQCIYFANCLKTKLSEPMKVALLLLLAVNYYMTTQLLENEYYLQF